jgi:drug/metabolite transporter (DMT)-like permease
VLPVSANSSHRLALINGLGAVLLWSTVATAFKISLAALTPLALVALASAVSWLFLLGVLYVTGAAQELRGLQRRSLVYALTLGLLNPGLYYLVLFAAYDALLAQEAMALNYTWALVLPLLAVPLLRQPLKGRDAIAALISYSGVVVIATRGDVTGLTLSNPAGVALAIGSTLLWALYWIANTKISLSPVVSLFLNFSAAAPLLLLAALWRGDLDSVSLTGALGAVYIGLFEMGLSFILWLRAMRLTNNTARISTLIFLAPPLSLLLIWWLLNEPVMPSTLVGLVFILGGLGWQQHQKATGD